MSENREDLNWDSAQQTHREIQEEILHSRNLELFEDVERLLPPGPFPKCEEKEMPVDTWDPEDQKRKIVALSPKSRSKAKVREKEVAASILRGDAIPDGATHGFRSVADLMKDQGRTISLKGKGKGMANTVGGSKRKKGDSGVEVVAAATKGKKRKALSPIRSTNGEDDDDDVEEDEDLLYGAVKTTGTAKKVKKAVAKGKEKGKGKAKGNVRKPTAFEAEMDVEEAEEDSNDPKVIMRKEAEEGEGEIYR
jgi:ATP-dependent DNA helicase MPH1